MKSLRVANLKSDLLVVFLIFSSILISYNIEKIQIVDRELNQIESSIITPSNSNYGNKIKNSYISHAPIDITSDSDLTVFPGSGTKDDPYIIENYNITSSSTHGIYISGTTKYILIRDCYLDGEGSNYHGIYIKSIASGTLTVTNNIMNNYRYGIYQEQSSINSFTSNTITNSSYSIYLYSSSLNSFTSNTITNSSEYGVDIAYSSTNSFTSNTITNSYKWGIHLDDSSINNSFTSNTITNSSYGIYIAYSSTNSFTSNTITNSSSYGIYLGFSSNNNTFVKNILINNRPLAYSQGYDDGTGNRFYSETTGNYWNDWSGSGVYPIDGSANNSDPYPMYVDLDQDNIPDRWEKDNSLDPLVDDSAEDPDSDGLTNLEEYQAGTDPLDSDTDSDGLTDGDEVNTYGTDPLASDTDSDGMPDGWEVENSLNPLTDDSAEDPDSDGLTNLEEYQAGTDPTTSDTDGDGLTDGEEVNIYSTDPLASDTDNDGMPDGWEVENSLDSLIDDSAEDLDSDGLTNLEEYQAGTDPLDSDTDSDGLTDGDEVNTYGTDPLSSDTDGDGLTDNEEINTYGTDPLDSDTDSDGLTDNEEINTYGTDPLSSDTDGDGLTDNEEINTYGTDPLSSDTDGDGMPDGWEVENGKNPTKKNIYLTIGEKVAYFAILSLFTIVTVVVIYNLRMKKKTKKKLERLTYLQSVLDEKYKEFLTNISSLLILVSSIEKLKNYLEKLGHFLEYLLFVRKNIKRLRNSERAQVNKIFEETIDFLNVLQDKLISLLEFVDLTNLEEYTKEVMTNLLNNWSDKEFQPLIVSYEELLFLLNYFLIFREESLRPFNNFISLSEPLWSEIKDLATEKLTIVQDLLEQNKQLLSELAKIINDSENNTMRLERLKKVSSVYNKINLNKLTPLLDFEDKEVLKLWLYAYSKDVPNRIEGQEVIFDLQFDGEFVSEDMTTAIDDLLQQFSEWERTGKGKKK